jgi:hypothetical protein
MDDKRSLCFKIYADDDLSLDRPDP